MIGNRHIGLAQGFRPVDQIFDFAFAVKQAVGRVDVQMYK
jgi:hypothetical protein